jgi:hypothetical protein
MWAKREHGAMFKLRKFRNVATLGILAGITACDGGSHYYGPPISIAFSTAPPASVAIGTTASLVATVNNDPYGNGASWTVTCGSAQCGSLNPEVTASGAPTTYTPPATLPNPATVTIRATSVTDGTKSVSTSLTITAATGPVLANGTYIYYVPGADANGGYTIVGAFTVANGLITGGEQDFSDPNGGYTDTLVAASSSLAKAGGNVQIVLDTGNGAIGVQGLETLRGTVVSPTRILLSEFDPSAAGTGSADLQSGTAAPAAGYAFAISGNDPHGNALAIGGILNFSGTSLVAASSVFDISAFSPNSNAPSVLQNQAFQSGSVTVPDALGRVVFTLTPSSASGVSAFALAGYIIGPNKIQLVESAESGDLLNANTGGSALGQGANTGTFSAAAVANQTYAQGIFGVDPNNSVAMAGVFLLAANGILGGTLAVNDLTNIGTWTMGGTYAVQPSGRVTVSVTSLSSPSAAPPASALTFELYLDGNGNAMVIGADGFQTTQGIAYSSVPAVATALSGDYGLVGQGALFSNQNGLQPWGAVGPVAVNTTTFSGATDYTQLNAAPQSAVTLAGSQNVAGGTLALTGLNAFNFQSTTSFDYYAVSADRFWAIELDSQGISLLMMEPVTP